MRQLMERVWRFAQVSGKFAAIVIATAFLNDLGHAIYLWLLG